MTGATTEPVDAAGATVAVRAAIHHALGDPVRLAVVDELRLSDRSPSQLAALTGFGSNLIAFHLDVLERAGLIERRPSHGDRRRRYVRLRPDPLLMLGGPAAVTADDVVFVCTHNSARSQLSAAIWTCRTGRPARSAGTQPAAAVHPLAIEVARQHGLDLTGRVPQGLEAIDGQPDLVVHVCDRAAEAGSPFRAPSLHWSVRDPADGARGTRGAATAAEDDLGPFVAAFDELARRIETLATAVEAA